MLDLGWSELLLIGIVALIVVGPKDLPLMFRALGKFTARLRGMARDFTRAMEEAADESGVKDVAKDLRNMSNPKAMGVDALKKATSMDDLEFDPFGEDDEVADEAAAKPAAKPRGPETQKMTEERAEAARKIRESAAARATARLEAEAAARAEAATAPEPEAPAADPNKA